MKTFRGFLIGLLAASVMVYGADRFDMSIRGDFFAGFAGDKAALDRAMKACEEKLAANPQHAEAMVWHGSGNLFLAGKMLQKGDFAAGGQLWGQALKEMDIAVAIAPETVGVLIPRGATLLSASAGLPGPQGKALLEKGVGDYEKVHDIQKSYFDTLSGHARGELLFGLADGYNRLDRKNEAKSTFEILAAVGKTSGHEDQAHQYLTQGNYAKTNLNCTGCHTGK